MIFASAYHTGQLLEASITIRGALAVGLAVIRRDSSSDAQGKSDDDDLALVFNQGAESRVFVVKTDERTYTGHCYLDTASMRKSVDDKCPMKLTCLPIQLQLLSSNRTVNDAEATFVLEGILVEKVAQSGAPSNQYMRVGYFTATSGIGDSDAGFAAYVNLRAAGRDGIASRLGFKGVENIVLI